MATRTFGELKKEAEASGGFSNHPAGTFTMMVAEATVKRGSSQQAQIQVKLQTVDQGPEYGKTLLNTMSPEKNNGEANAMFFQQMGAFGYNDPEPLWA